MADTWTPISGYTPQDYSDTMVFEMSSETKNVEKILGQVLIAGEENSQYIKFVLSRYWDGIDISGKTFSIEYALAGKYYGTSEAVNAEMSAEQIRFGWVVPAEACCVSGTLFFILKVESEGYVLKSRIVEEPVYKTIDVGDVVPEPTKEAWYREFAARVEAAIDDAEAAIEAAQAAQSSAETAAQNAQTAEDNAEAAAAAAQIRYGSPLVAQTAEEMVEQNRVYVYTGSETGYTAGHWYYHNGTEWVDGGVYNGSAVNTDTTLTQSGMAADAKAVGDKLSTIKEDLQDLPNVVETDETNSDFDIADPNGNVLARFANGHIETEEFNSAEVQKTEPTDADGAFDFADSEGYVLVRLKDGHIQTKDFNSEYVPSVCEYLFADDDSILLSYGYNDTHDAVVSMNEGRANGLFDFKALMLKPKGKPLAECGSSDFSTIWLTGTDMHSPFEFLAVNSPDGYYADSTDPGYTGGNHTADINGVTVQTAKSNGIRYFADGKPVTSGHGVFAKFEMRWANEVQAYNCVKADGTGRASLTEYHDMIFDGVKFDEEITLIPDEDVNMYLWHGLQVVGWNGVYDHVFFVDATNRQIFTPSDSNVKSGNAITSGVVQYGDTHAMRMDIDTTKDLGKRPNYTGTEGAFMSSSIHKGYFRIFYGSPVLMAKDSVWYLHGSFRFYPV